MSKTNIPTFRLVVKFREGSLVSAGKRVDFSTISAARIRLLEKLFSGWKGISVGKLFISFNDAEVLALAKRARELDPDYQSPDFLAYYTIDCPVDCDSRQVMDIIRGSGETELAYVESVSPAPPAAERTGSSQWTRLGYLERAPRGIDAGHVRSFIRGNGQPQVKLVDIEQGWIMEHESFRIKSLPRTGMHHPAFRDHGAAVAGTILINGRRGFAGIAPDVDAYAISQWRPDGSFNTADAILSAAAGLGAGDLILVEAQTFHDPCSDRIWPVEIQDAVFETIRLVTALGIVVIEPAGNGQTSFGKGNDLDDFDAGGNQTLNPYSRHFRDSGAILVSAAGSLTPHRRLNFSNYGSRVDCFAWGEAVFTAGSYPGLSGGARDAYTWTFGGTSAAAAIIAGAAILCQQAYQSKYRARLSPKQIRTLMRDESLTTPSAGGRGADKIGGMPDLKKIMRVLG